MVAQKHLSGGCVGESDNEERDESNVQSFVIVCPLSSICLFACDSWSLHTFVLCFFKLSTLFIMPPAATKRLRLANASSQLCVVDLKKTKLLHIFQCLL